MPIKKSTKRCNFIGGLPMFDLRKNLATLLLVGVLIPTYKASADEISPISPLAPATTTAETDAQKIFFVSTDGIRVRSTPTDEGQTVGLLSLNDKVRLINANTIYNEKYVEVEIVKTMNKISLSEHYYVNKNYIAENRTTYKTFDGKYFVVVNVATETLRLYERVCADNSCPHKMIMETEIVAGEDTDHKKEEKGKGRSILGSYRVTNWTKFYEDSNGHYPAWYKDGYPAVPLPGDSGRDWFSKKFMPEKQGVMRGAFGWYTAFVTPEPFGQWTHGTIGWGADKDVFIKRAKKTLINIVSDPRSSGCTRNNNEAIAFLREKLDVGAPIIKIYAQEAIQDLTLSKYPEQNITWNYILTKNRSQKADRAAVTKELGLNDQDVNAYWEAKRNGGEVLIDPKSPLNQILEVGSYELDSHPDAIAFTPKEKMHGSISRAVGRKGNIYGMKTAEMHGVFYVDSGMLSEYAHPDRVLESSGFPDETTPPWMDVKNIQNKN